MVRITREMVLAGSEHRQTVEIPSWDEKASMVIRPITDSQFMTMQAVIFEGVKMDDKEEPLKDQTMVEVNEREKQVRRMAVAFALSVDGEKWTVEDVALLTPGAVDKLYAEVAIISGFPVGRRPRPAPSAESEEAESKEAESPTTI